MVSLVQGPLWFLWSGFAIDLLGAAVLWLVAARTTKYHTVSKDGKWLRVSSAFALLSIAFVGRALLTIGLSSKPWGLLHGGVVSLTTHHFLLRSLMFFIAVFLFELIMLYGLFLLFTVYHETSKTLTGFVAFLLALVLFFAVRSYFIFHLLALVLLLLITTSLVAWYRKNHSRVTSRLAWAFGVLSASQFLFILVLFSAWLYVAAELLQLLGFLMIAWALVVISRGKKIPS